MLKLNYLDAPKLLYRMGIKFYSTKVIKHKKRVVGMWIGLVDPLTKEQALFLHAIDTFYVITPTPTTVMFQSFAQHKRETQS